ncbi:MAG: L-2-amino-thiazoline-4-carboxylic acid hydrolase [Eubacteriales bacterium]
MEAQDKVKILQATYAGALADSVFRLGNEGVLDKVSQQKRNEQLLYGKNRAAQMGINKEEDVFVKLSDLFGCADWKITVSEDGNGFTATSSKCMLCAMAKKIGTKSPCNIYCLDPMEGMIKGFNEKAIFHVQDTLFDGSQCQVKVSTEKQL